jgi:uncharacterized OsmC-like protein
MLTYRVSAVRVDKHGSRAFAKSAEIVLDTDLGGRDDALNPVELLLAALAACIIKGIERVTPMIKFELDGVEISLEAERQDSPPKVTRIRYNLSVHTTESDQRLELLHANVRKYGTIFNTIANATDLSGEIRRLP